jgi:hypothetical protein
MSVNAESNFYRQLSVREQITLELIAWCAAEKHVSPEGQSLDFFMPNFVAEKLIDDECVQLLHVTALRRISEALGHPLKGVDKKTALDLADIAVAKIQTNDELNALAHKIAYDAAAATIECCCISIDEGTVENRNFYDLANDGNDSGAERAIADSVRYLEARGLIEHHPDNPNWIALRDESEATR